MNNYHFYEEIGKGKHSVVYRCRKKKCVEFCAIKSVDKVSRAKVLNEVSHPLALSAPLCRSFNPPPVSSAPAPVSDSVLQVMVLHSLNHRNVLKFHTWYETKNHIWLIMEYCTGGDLLNVLLQDTKLPEAAICHFGYDLMEGLQYIHSKSVVCCDLKPSNILLDEDGTLKFSDFGLSQLLGDIGTATAEQSKRGTPCYMAPELFRDDGYHSFASDFWALGCVLYEMAAGRPPFVSTSFRDLMDQILSHDYPPIPGSSQALNELLQQLLNKERFRRMTWPELLSCPFWADGERGAPAPMALPGQPRFDSELDALRARARQQAAEQAAEDDEAAAVAAQLESRGRAGRRGGGGGGAVDVLRLSRAANNNLAKEVERAQEGDGDDGGYGNDAGAIKAPEAEDVQLAGPDVELNFSDGAAEEKTVGKTVAGGGGASGGGDDHGEAAEGRSEMARMESAAAAGESVLIAAAAAADEEEEEEEIEIEEEEPIGPIRVVERRAVPIVSDVQGPDYHVGPGESRPVTAPETGSSAPPPVDTAADSSAGPAEPQQNAVRPATTATGTRAEQEDKTAAGAHLRAGRGASGPPTVHTLEKLLYHGSDSGVKPIVNNKRIEAIVVPAPYERSALAFEARTLQEMLSLAEHDTAELEQFLTSIFRSVGGPVPVAKKVNTLAYFETLCVDTNAANILINSSLMSLFVPAPSATRVSLPVSLCVSLCVCVLTS